MDDNDMVRRTLERSLVRAGYEVITATDGLTALAQLDQTPVDVVASDVTMPGMDGLELLLALRRRAPALPVILLSGTETAPSNLAGAFRFLQKPIAEAELLAAIAAAVAQPG